MSQLAKHANEDAMTEDPQFVTFYVDGKHYGLNIQDVREIKAWTHVTPLPNTPSSMRGVLNLRGAIVPIYDLRAVFGQGLTHPTTEHVNLIVSIQGRIVGFLVDAVSDILSFAPDQIQPPPRNRGKEVERMNSVMGLGESNGVMTMLLDIHTLIGNQLPVNDDDFLAKPEKKQ
ncbi:MAG: chemotaxis protein CheW [Alphaproteobacteria bacterium]